MGLRNSKTFSDKSVQPRQPPLAIRLYGCCVKNLQPGPMDSWLPAGVAIAVYIVLVGVFKCASVWRAAWVTLHFVHDAVNVCYYGVRDALHGLVRLVRYRRTVHTAFGGRTFGKVPAHVGVIVEGRIEFDDLAFLLMCCLSAGTRFVSLYDHAGSIKECESQLHAAVDRQIQKLYGNAGVSSADLFIRQSFLNGNETSPTTTAPASDDRRFCGTEGESDIHGTPQNVGTVTGTVRLTILSANDGKQELVRIARSLCDDIVRGVRVPGDATLAYVDANVWTSKAAAPDPDLILNTSSLNGTVGFPPWSLRVASIMNIGPLKRLTYDRFAQLMERFGGVEQRFGY